MQKRKLGNSGLEVSAIGLGCMGLSFGYGPADGQAGGDRADPRGRRARRHLLRHRRGLRPVHERGAGRRGARAVPRPGGDRHQVRLRDRRRRRAERPEQPAGAHPGRSPRPRSSGSGPTRIDLFYQHRVDPNVPIEDVAGAVKELIQRGQGQALRPLRGGRRRRSAAPTRSSRSPRSRASTRCGGASPRAEILPTLRGARHRLRALQPAGQGLPHRQDRREHDVRQHATSATSSRASRRRPGRRTRPWSICSARSRRGSRRRRRRSRSPGCWRRSRGSCRSRAPRSCIAWRRTSARPPSS